MARLSTLLALSLADATILQYNIILSAENLRQAAKALIYDSDLQLSNTTTGRLATPFKKIKGGGSANFSDASAPGF